MIEYKSSTPTAVATTHSSESTALRMARAMRELAHAGRVVDREALSLRGFTRAELDRYGDEARDLAHALEAEAV